MEIVDRLRSVKGQWYIDITDIAKDLFGGIVKKVEITDNLTAMDVDDIILQKCKEENGFDYQWMHTSEINEQRLTGLFDGLR